MFEVSGTEIAELGDADLRTLVARLALAELRAQGCPASSVTAGGNQDAADGGLDVRVDCLFPIPNPDFVPRQLTGFQVKKPSMPASAIRKEMRPNDKLRRVIRELAEASGAYVIVSAQASVADKSLSKRKEAIRAALHDLTSSGQLHTDFYDRERLATWVNGYPGIAAWVQSRVGRPLAGWSTIEGWDGSTEAKRNPYLVNEKACLVDERSRDRAHLTITEGIGRLRAALRTPQQSIRLVGLSGLGKTRLVRALFERGVGEEPLDPSISIYTDYSEETDPTAREMARQLLRLGQRAILIVDNCNPTIHTELAHLCTKAISKLSLITIEYDVRDDDPEHTEVFRLQSVSPELVAQWLTQIFPNVSELDCGRIAEFSDGNFRIARALAEPLGKGDTLAHLKSRELFQRIFQQRHEPDQQLLRAAEDLSILYSIDGQDTSSAGELALIGRIRNVDSSLLYGAIVELRRRGVAQARGRWRAILPHAIANPLASFALERIPPSDFDRFCATLPHRMIQSVSRRLGLLHDSTDAQAAVARWLRTDGPLGNLIALSERGLQIITNIAPVAPEAVLKKLARELDGPDADQVLAPNAANRWQWIQLIKMLGYDAHSFEAAVSLLARFLVSGPQGHHHSSARDAFSALFHLHRSGTQATPEQRRQAITHLALSRDPALQRCASVALEAHLKASHFVSIGGIDFGARSRDWGWRPRGNKDIWDWYDAAILLAVELVPHLEDARSILAEQVRELWHFAARHDTLDATATTLVRDRPWVEGWIAFRGTLRFDGEDMSDDLRSKLEDIIQRLKPSDLLHQARAVVLSRANCAWDVADGESDDGNVMRPWERASQMAQDVGRSLAHDAVVRREFLAELLVEQHAQRAFDCGRGLAQETSDLGSMWRELVADYGTAEPRLRNATVLGGFLRQADQRNSTFAGSALENAIDDPHLSGVLPYLQAIVGIDGEGIARLRRAISEGALTAESFSAIANGAVCDSPAEPLAALIQDIGDLPDGVEIALDILHMHIYGDREQGIDPNPHLIRVGRGLLALMDFSRQGLLRGFGLRTVIRICLAGDAGSEAARRVCASLRSSLESAYTLSHDLSYILKALFETQPFIALDEFLLPQPSHRNPQLFDEGFGLSTPIADLDPVLLRQWADCDRSTRYPLLGQCLSMFGKSTDDEEQELSPPFLSMLDYAPDKRHFLGGFWYRLQPRSWSGSLGDILVRRRSQILKLADRTPDASVRAWVDEMLPELDRWIDSERSRDRDDEERFE